MGYSKLVIYGRNAQLYEYERNINDNKRKNIRRSTRYDVSNGVEKDRDITLPTKSKRLGKRSDSAQRACVAFKRLVIANLGGSENPLFLTTTYKENETRLDHGYKDFTTFIQSLRYRYGKVFKYIAVPEFQKRGAVHFHCLFWGLSIAEIGRIVPYSECRIKNLCENDFWKHGFLFLKETDGHERLSNYLVKYMAKAFVTSEFHGKKAYVSSRNCARPQYISGYPYAHILFDDFCGQNGVSYDTTVYETSYLGQCKRSSYFDNELSTDNFDIKNDEAIMCSKVDFNKTI